MAVVLELLHGDDLESLSRKYAVTAATLSSWRDSFLASGEAGLKIREDDLVDEQGRRMKSVIAELAMSNELLRERIQQLENGNPSLKWRSKR
jgi:transposase-like protein